MKHTIMNNRNANMIALVTLIRIIISFCNMFIRGSALSSVLGSFGFVNMKLIPPFYTSPVLMRYSRYFSSSILSASLVSM